MQNSIIMRRVLSLLIVTLLLSAALTAVFYSLTSNVVFTRISTADYRQKAEYIAAKSSAFDSGSISSTSYESILESAPDMLNASVAVHFFPRSNSVLVYTPSNRSLTAEELDEIKKMVAETAFPLPIEGYYSKHVYLGDKKVDTLFVGVPIMVSDKSSGGLAVGGMVYIMRSFQEIKASQSSLNFSLIFASCVAFLLMMAPTIFAVSTVLRPLRSVRNVAIAMANGNFSLRADSSQQGEIGELAASVNDLASALDQSISALMIERNRLQQILDGLSEGILATSADLTITHLNPAVKALFENIRQHDNGVKHEPLDEVDFANDEEELNLSRLDLENSIVRDIAQLYRDTMTSRSYESQIFTIGDQVVQLQVSPLLDNKSHVIGAVGLFRDITATEKLEQTRRDYIANVSHELRTPLTALRGLIEPLSDGLVTEKEDQERYYRIILDETLRLSRLIDDMLELSRLQAGTLSLKMSVFDLGDVLDNLRNKYYSLAKQSKVTLRFPENDSYTAVYGNADRTEQILVILIDNAFKFTPQGGEINIFILDAKDKLEISVQDSGKGIEQADITHIFERFYKADKSRGKSGTGLGLSIAREIMKAMGEEIWAVSKPGQGARFTFTLTKVAGSDEAPQDNLPLLTSDITSETDEEDDSPI